MTGRKATVLLLMSEHQLFLHGRTPPNAWLDSSSRKSSSIAAPKASTLNMVCMNVVKQGIAVVSQGMRKTWGGRVARTSSCSPRFPVASSPRCTQHHNSFQISASTDSPRRFVQAAKRRKKSYCSLISPGTLRHWLVWVWGMIKTVQSCLSHQYIQETDTWIFCTADLIFTMSSLTYGKEIRKGGLESEILQYL